MLCEAYSGRKRGVYFQFGLGQLVTLASLGKCHGLPMVGGSVPRRRFATPYISVTPFGRGDAHHDRFRFLNPSSELT